MGPQIRAIEFHRSYAAAFDAYIAESNERTLHAAYELGRGAVAHGLGVVEVAAVHHDVLSEALTAVGTTDATDLVAGACDFFVETLAAFEMVQRSYGRARERAQLEQRHAALVRQLSTLLSDTSLATGAADSLPEVLQLVAEQALELTSAISCVASARSGKGRKRITAIAGDYDLDVAVRPNTGRNRILVPVVSLDGAELGTLEATYGSEFTDRDEAILIHLAQMAAATIERVPKQLTNASLGNGGVDE